MGKAKKAHRAKVKKRNAKIKQQKDNYERLKEKFIMSIMREAEDKKAAEQKAKEAHVEEVTDVEIVESEQSIELESTETKTDE